VCLKFKTIKFSCRSSFLLFVMFSFMIAPLVSWNMQLFATVENEVASRQNINYSCGIVNTVEMNHIRLYSFLSTDAKTPFISLGQTHTETGSGLYKLSANTQQNFFAVSSEHIVEYIWWSDLLHCVLANCNFESLLLCLNIPVALLSVLQLCVWFALEQLSPVQTGSAHVGMFRLGLSRLSDNI